MDEQTHTESRGGIVAGAGETLTRRTVLVGAAGVGVAALAGCLGEDDEDAPDPITIDADQACDQCTMQIGQHPGPVGQTHYDDPDDVVGEDRPAQFCSSTCTYSHTFEQENAGHDPTATYLTDYSIVDYDIELDDDIEEISSHLEADAFAGVEGLTLVVDSDVQGAMGPSMIGFGDADEAEEFQTEYGGDLYEHEDVTSELVMSLMG
ncbi:nitrous oxide reductase accessory protein NosL [Natrialba swarupiae]|uniref:Nitrous oxide reductase accessory protein NosL n=1 Tax=Natrialba swarupiae TaxID=2448032 RepID=A0A5D5APD3_9EURY|nr:nitrous oxide reductase accessory protein NosL [Natrialba swarupiae]MCW8173344.1 nitrous oxide reductase accessory protein NosL [Natrialba swarupiae]TYT60941.1 nitrous oxide reductase accessory protein NosL [Natrialba swarupiae]